MMNESNMAKVVTEAIRAHTEHLGPGHDALPPEEIGEVAARAVYSFVKMVTVSQFLEHGPVLIHLDPRRPGVEVPDEFKQGPDLVLRIGHGLKPAIPDLDVCGDGISATLLFGSRPFRCRVPWPALFAAKLEGQDAMSAWHDSVPDELLCADHKHGPDCRHEPAEKTEPKKRHLSLVPDPE